jgi:fermentation-respiration switch protein FrsA (DUF1100 family)
MSGWQTAQTILVAPYYGATGGAKRGGFNQEFVERIRHAEYPDYMWDVLPIGGSTDDSILMLKQIQPIGRHHNSYELTKYRLNPDAFDVLDDWVAWLLTGVLDSEGILQMFRRDIRGLE